MRKEEGRGKVPILGDSGQCVYNNINFKKMLNL